MIWFRQFSKHPFSKPCLPIADLPHGTSRSWPIPTTTASYCSSLLCSLGYQLHSVVACCCCCWLLVTVSYWLTAVASWVTVNCWLLAGWSLVVVPFLLRATYCECCPLMLNVGSSSMIAAHRSLWIVVACFLTIRGSPGLPNRGRITISAPKGYPDNNGRY